MALRLWALLVILWPARVTHAQTTNIQPLTIGDTIPADLVIHNVYNYPASQIRLSDLKGKLVILDFWATWCAPCISSIPKMNNLAKQFGNKLFFLLANTSDADTEEKVISFFQNREKRTGQKSTLPYVLQDTVIEKMFPHRYLPHYIWINTDGVIKAITGKEDITEKNIDDFLQGKEIQVRKKNDFAQFNPAKPLLVDGNGGNPDDFIYRSVITPYKEGLGSFIKEEHTEANLLKRYYIINYPLLSLFQIAYPDVFKIGIKRVLIEAPNPQRFERETPNEQQFSYELILSEPTAARGSRYLQDDLKKCFNLVAKLEQRKIACYILKLKDHSKYPFTKGGTPSIDFEKDALHKHLKNMPVLSLIEVLDPFLKKPIINEVQEASNIDIDFPVGVHDFSENQIISLLKKYGFELIVEERTISMSVIKPLEN